MSDPATAPRPAPLTELTPEEALFRDVVRSFADDHVRPRVSEMDLAGRLAPDVLARLFELGLMAIEIPERFGGSGGKLFDSVLAIEELSRVDAAVGLVVDLQNTVVSKVFQRFASPALHERYLPRLATRAVGSYALSEATSGSDAFALRCRAERRGDRWVLNGRKLWITNAAEAEIFVVFATVDPSAGYRGITGFVIERDSAGFTIGRHEEKLGMRASSTCELVLDGCEVTDDRVLGDVGRGYKIAIETLNEGRIGIGAQMLGLARGALEGAVAYAKQRVQFGRPISEHQAMQFWLAEMATEIEAARLLVWNAARLADAGRPFVREAAMAKLHASRVAERVASRALEVYGGCGYTRDFPAEKFYRDAKVGSIYEGTTFMQLQTIAKMLLAD